jgi:carbonic anhydrase
VIKFENDKESLEDFVANFVKGKVHLAEDIDEQLKNLDDDLDKAAEEIDKLEKLFLKQQLEALREQLTEVQRERKVEYYYNIYSNNY